MVLVSVVLTYFTQNPINYPMMAIAAISAILVYAGKNLIMVLHSNSPAGSLSLINIISALLILIGNGIMDGVAMYLIDGAVAWGVLGKIVVSITLTYVITTWFSPPYSPVKKKLFV